MVLQTQDASKLTMKGEGNNTQKCEIAENDLEKIKIVNQVQSLSAGQQKKWSSRHKTLQLAMRGGEEQLQNSSKTSYSQKRLREN